MFDKSIESFPHKQHGTFLSFCSVSPLYRAALDAEYAFQQSHSEFGVRLFNTHRAVLPRLRKVAAKLLKTETSNVSVTSNTAMGINHIANGYPFEQGDEVIVYEHEYPSNYYPWVQQSRERGVKLVCLPDRGDGRLQAHSWSMDDLERHCTDKTKVIALSHVQFTSGYAADLTALGAFCRERSIDLVLDVAQSLGVLPVHPEEVGVSAVASSGWKWLMGPIGSGLLYTSEEFRSKIKLSMFGSEMMKQDPEYLNHTWDPKTSGEVFEYSTSVFSYAAGLEKCISEVFVKYGVETIKREVFRLQDLLLEGLDRNLYEPILFEDAHRSGILSVIPQGDPIKICNELYKQGLTITPRDGYIRLAPHFCTTEEEIERALVLLNSLEAH